MNRNVLIVTLMIEMGMIASSSRVCGARRVNSDSLMGVGNLYQLLSAEGRRNTEV
jgi:hypothetical protein